MTKLKTLSAVLILSAAIATPVFAEDANVAAPHHTRVHHERNYRGAYNSASGSSSEAPRVRENTEYGYGAQDRSRIGGQDPDMNPPS